MIRRRAKGAEIHRTIGNHTPNGSAQTKVSVEQHNDGYAILRGGVKEPLAVEPRRRMRRSRRPENWIRCRHSCGARTQCRRRRGRQVAADLTGVKQRRAFWASSAPGSPESPTRIKVRGFRVHSEMLSNGPLHGWGAGDHLRLFALLRTDKSVGIGKHAALVKTPPRATFGSGRKFLRSMKQVSEQHPNNPK
jgi:hypothetical protein